MVCALRRYLGAVLTFSWVARSDGHCRGLDRRALINLYEALDGANWTNNKNWNVTSGTPAENMANDPCFIEKRLALTLTTHSNPKPNPNPSPGPNPNLLVLLGGMVRVPYPYP